MDYSRSGLPGSREVRFAEVPPRDARDAGFASRAELRAYLETPVRTRATLAAIRRRPRVAASRLAKALRRETQPFKADVRKLKRFERPPARREVVAHLVAHRVRLRAGGGPDDRRRPV